MGEKFDKGKPDYSLMPFDALEGAVRVLTFGAQKYERHGWGRVPNARDRYYSAAQRHMTAYMRGEKSDPESGLDHLDHALCCLLFMSQLSKDDREE